MTEPPDEVLHRSSLFRFLAPDDFDRLRSLLHEEHFEFGDVIIRQGAEAAAFYVLISGRVRVVKERENGEEIALATLRPGDDFGELGLVARGDRIATVRCSTAVDVLRLDRSDFLALLTEHPGLQRSLALTARHRTLHGFLYEFSNFGRLPPRALHALLEELAPIDFTKGDIIIREGDPAGPMFIVETGRIRVFATRNGRERNLAFYRAGDFFGELSILNGSPRAAFAQALTDTRVLALRPDTVRELEERFPEFRTLLEERRAQYRADIEARVPLDFAEALLPVEAKRRNKTALDAEAAQPTADERDFFGLKSARIESIPHVQQIDEVDCGAACLAMVCRHFGREVSLSHIRQRCHTSRDGTTLKAICQAATELGLAARALKVSPRNLPELPLPAIVHWEGDHWVVLYDVGESHVSVADPAVGSCRLEREEFEAKWSGHAACFERTGTFAQAPETRGALARLIPLVNEHAGILSTVLLLGAIGALLELLFPILAQFVVDAAIAEKSVSLVHIIVLAMGAAWLVIQAGSLVRNFVLSFTAVRIEVSLLDFLTRQLYSLPMSWFHRRRSHDIQRRIESVRHLREFAIELGLGTMLALITLIGAVVVMACYSPVLAGLFLITIPLHVALIVLSSKVLRPIEATAEESGRRFAVQQMDAVRGIEAVKSAGAELTVREAMLGELQHAVGDSQRSRFIVWSRDAAQQGIGLLATLLCAWVGAQKVMAGDLTMGAFIAAVLLTAMASAAVVRVLRLRVQSPAAAVWLDRLNDLLEPDPEQGRDRSDLKPVPSLEGRIELRNVGFKYGGIEAPGVLKGINLEIEPGRLIAIVGRSGSGKTTLVKMLTALIEPTEGTILFDHLEAARLNWRDVRRQIGLVLQENHIFTDTVARNIALGDPEPDFDRVLQCAQMAGAHDFLMRLPQGYETIVGDSGLALSAGQRQRIAIARALYADPPILIFDEATSGLDRESEQTIEDNLQQMIAGRTCIVVAHRLGAIRDADAIVVLEKGEVVEVGTHDELMARRGLYFHLSSRQLGVA